eukprot:TRINITY_DN12452_c0_g1_i1.p1 TRINITY_DN12452_c0_g1~~TRINITY_DN12452_c0_g1_i1.p1  ORF type:complete len:150 (+),score=39.33 TRINITY_DN12452_c0_g1_i1:89-538(+)
MSQAPPSDMQDMDALLMQEEASLTEDQKRFLLDLEFVQALANPGYLRHLATDERKYFEDEDFLAYLNYLKYWKRPEYAKFITYPNCLYFLDRLLDGNFREHLFNPVVIQFIEEQQQRHYNLYRSRRIGNEPNPSLLHPAAGGTPTKPGS